MLNEATDRTAPVIIQPLTPSWMALLFPNEFKPGESWAEYHARRKAP